MRTGLTSDSINPLLATLEFSVPTKRSAPSATRFTAPSQATVHSQMLGAQILGQSVLAAQRATCGSAPSFPCRSTKTDAGSPPRQRRSVRSIPAVSASRPTSSGQTRSRSPPRTESRTPSAAICRTPDRGRSPPLRRRTVFELIDDACPEQRLWLKPAGTLPENAAAHAAARVCQRLLHPRARLPTPRGPCKPCHPRRQLHPRHVVAPAAVL